MAIGIIALLVFLSFSALAQSDDQQPGVSGATVPVMHTDKPAEVPAPKPVPVEPVETPAQIAADQAIRKQADTDISDYASRLSDTCDTDIKARIDWTTVSALQTHRYSPADACGAALQAIEQLCGNQAGKQRVTSEVKSVICTTGPHPSVEMHAGTLVYTIDWQSADPGTKVYAWLASHL